MYIKGRGNKYIKKIDSFENKPQLSDTQREFLRKICGNNYRVDKKGFVHTNETVIINNENIEDLSFIPWGVINGNFGLLNNKFLTSLKGCPVKITGSFFVSNSPKLKSLEYISHKIGDSISCTYSGLTTLKGLPKKIRGDFDVSYNFLTSLKNCPEEIGGSFIVNYNQLTSLEEGPKKVFFNYLCSCNLLTSLKGLPERINELRADSNKLKTLDCKDVIIEDFFDISSNDDLVYFDDCPKSMKHCRARKCGSLRSFKGLSMDKIYSLVYSRFRGAKEGLVYLWGTDLKDIEVILEKGKKDPVLLSLIKFDSIKDEFKKNPGEAVIKFKDSWKNLLEFYPELNDIEIPKEYKNILNILSDESDFGF